MLRHTVLATVFSLILAPAMAQKTNPVSLTPTPEDAEGMAIKPSFSPYTRVLEIPTPT